MKKQRKQYAPEEKVAILRRHLLENEPISKLCDEVGLQPTVFYRWQKEFFENGASAFEQKTRPNHSVTRQFGQVQTSCFSLDRCGCAPWTPAVSGRITRKQKVGTAL